MIMNLIAKLIQKKNQRVPALSGRSVFYYEEPKIIFIPANQITGILDVDKPYFWNHHGNTIDDYLLLAKKSEILYQKWQHGLSISDLAKDSDCKDISEAYLSDDKMIQVYKKSDMEYEWANDGRHRAAAAQKLGIYILVKVLGEYM